MRRISLYKPRWPPKIPQAGPKKLYWRWLGGVDGLTDVCGSNLKSLLRNGSAVEVDVPLIRIQLDGGQETIIFVGEQGVRNRPDLIASSIGAYVNPAPMVWRYVRLRHGNRRRDGAAETTATRFRGTVQPAPLRIRAID